MEGRNRKVGAPAKHKIQTDHHDAGQNRRPDETDQVKLAVFSAEMIPQDPPAQLRDQTDLARDAEFTGYISHESSSICGRPYPSWPTSATKIFSSGVWLAFSVGVSARSSSMDPCAPSRPL